MTHINLVREVRINGETLRLADVLRWAEKNPDASESESSTDVDLLIGYLCHWVAIKRCGRDGQVVNSRVNTWSRDGRDEDIEVTIGRPAPPESGATWTDCSSYWFHKRASELEPAAEALALYRRYRQAERDLYAEFVEVAYARRGGGAGVEIERFWIVYDPHVAGYADQDYRVNHRRGSGKTKQEALLSAITPRG